MVRRPVVRGEVFFVKKPGEPYEGNGAQGQGPRSTSEAKKTDPEPSLLQPARVPFRHVA